MLITRYLNKAILGSWETKPEFPPKPGYVWLNKPDTPTKEILTRYAAMAIFLNFAAPKNPPLIVCGCCYVLLLGIQILDFPPGNGQDKIEKAILKAKKYPSLPFFIVLIALVADKILNLKTKPLIGLSAYFSFLFLSYYIHRRTFKIIPQKSEIEGLDFKDIPTMHSGQMLDLSHSDVDDTRLELLCAKSFKKGEENNYDLNLTRCPSISYEGVFRVLTHFPNQLRITLTASALSNDDIYKLKIQNKAEIICDPFYHNSYHLFKKQNPEDFDLVFVFNQESRGGLESLEEEKCEDDNKSDEQRQMRQIYAHSSVLGFQIQPNPEPTSHFVIDARMYFPDDLESFLSDLYCRNFSKDFLDKLDDLKIGPLAGYFDALEHLKEIRFKKEIILESSSGEQYNICKWRLICRLPSFEKILNSPGREKNESLIKLALTPNELQQLLQFIKTGDEAIILQNSPLFSKHTQFFEGVPSITEPLKRSLRSLMDQKPLSLNNVVERLILAETHQMESLKNECRTFLREKLSLSVDSSPTISAVTIHDSQNVRPIFDWIIRHLAPTLHVMRINCPHRFLENQIDPGFGNHLLAALSKLPALKEIDMGFPLKSCEKFLEKFPRIFVTHGSKDPRKLSMTTENFLKKPSKEIEEIASNPDLRDLTICGTIANPSDNLPLENFSRLSHFENLSSFQTIISYENSENSGDESGILSLVSGITELINNNLDLSSLRLCFHAGIAFKDINFKKAFQKLENLNEVYLGVEYSKKEPLEFAGNFAKLERLAITNCTISENSLEADEFPKLQELSFCMCTISAVLLKSILVKSKNLKRLYLDNCTGIQSDSFEQIFNFPMALTSFDFDNTQLNQETFSRIKRYMPLIKD